MTPEQQQREEPCCLGAIKDLANRAAGGFDDKPRCLTEKDIDDYFAGVEWPPRMISKMSRYLIEECLGYFRSDATPTLSRIESWTSDRGLHKIADWIRTQIIPVVAHVSEANVYVRKDLERTLVQRQRLALLFNLQEIRDWADAWARADAQKRV
jgi:hypothetical protein